MPAVPSLRPAAQWLQRLSTIRHTEAKVTIGLDIGSTAIKAVALGMRKGAAQRPILGQNLVPLPTGQETTDISELIRSTIHTLQVPARSINLSVSGQWVIMRIVEMPTMKSGEMKQALPFEAQRYLPFNVQDVVIDGAVLGPAEGNKSWVLIVACKKDLIERRLDWVKRAGFDVAVIDVDALAVANAFLNDTNGHRPGETFAIINAGAQLTNVVIFRGESPYLVRDIPWGAAKLWRHLADQLGTEVEAVTAELSQGSSRPELLAALKVASESLMTELQLSFDYFENRFGQPPEQVLVSGGLSQSEPFMNLVKGQLTQPVTAWAPMKGLSGQFTVAYGLALRTS